METHTPACPQISHQEKLDALDWVMRGCELDGKMPEGVVLHVLHKEGLIRYVGFSSYEITARGSHVYGQHLRAVAKPCRFSFLLGGLTVAVWGGFGWLIWWAVS